MFTYRLSTSNTTKLWKLRFGVNYIGVILITRFLCFGVVSQPCITSILEIAGNVESNKPFRIKHLRYALEPLISPFERTWSDP